MIAKIADNLYLSGANAVKDINQLKELGIDAVLNVAWEESDPTYEDLLMVKIGLHEFRENTSFVISMAVIALENLISNGKTVLIHCHAGAHRSPYIAFRYLAEKEKSDIDSVYKSCMPNIPWGIVYPPQIK